VILPITLDLGVFDSLSLFIVSFISKCESATIGRIQFFFNIQLRLVGYYTNGYIKELLTTNTVDMLIIGKIKSMFSLKSTIIISGEQTEIQVEAECWCI
jgi:hypothetical protein